MNTREEEFDPFYLKIGDDQYICISNGEIKFKNEAQKQEATQILCEAQNTPWQFVHISDYICMLSTKSILVSGAYRIDKYTGIIYQGQKQLPQAVSCFARNLYLVRKQMFVYALPQNILEGVHELILAEFVYPTLKPLLK
jgi:hypothetical protein